MLEVFSWDLSSLLTCLQVLLLSLVSKKMIHSCMNCSRNFFQKMHHFLLLVFSGGYKILSHPHKVSGSIW